MTTDELQVPPTALELADLMSQATLYPSRLDKGNVDVLRRLMFAYDRLLAEAIRRETELIAEGERKSAMEDEAAVEEFYCRHNQIDSD